MAKEGVRSQGLKWAEKCHLPGDGHGHHWMIQGVGGCIHMSVLLVMVVV